MMAMSAARSRLASSQMINGDLPPSSIVTSLRVEPAALAMTFLPVSTPPVKEIFSITGCSVSHCPISRPAPCTTLNTPSGRPASV